MQPSTEKDLYKEPVTIVFADLVARVYSPTLDTAERTKRMKTIHNATANLFKKQGVKNEKRVSDR